MKYSYNLSGANQQLIKEYDIDPTTVIKKGEVVSFLLDKIVSLNYSAKQPLGVAEEDHSGVFEELNPRSAGTKIRVSVSPTAVYTGQMQPIAVTGAGDSSFKTTIAHTFDNYLINHKIIFVKKSVNSGATHDIGTVLNVTKVTMNGADLEVNVDKDVRFDIGDEYIIVPIVGDKLSVDTAGECFLSKTPQDNDGFVCVGADIENQTVDAMIRTSFFNK